MLVCFGGDPLLMCSDSTRGYRSVPKSSLLEINYVFRLCPAFLFGQLQNLIRFSVIHFAVMEHFPRCFWLKSDSRSFLSLISISCSWEKLQGSLAWFQNFFLSYFSNWFEYILGLLHGSFWFLERVFLVGLFSYWLTVMPLLIFFLVFIIHGSLVYLPQTHFLICYSYLTKLVSFFFASSTLF